MRDRIPDFLLFGLPVRGPRFSVLGRWVRGSSLKAGPRTNARGVTFLEIMIVLVIMGIFLILGIPSMRGYYEKNKLNAAARELVQIARYGRQQAILRSHATELRIRIDEDRYQLVLEVEQEKMPGGSRRRSQSPNRMAGVRNLDNEKGRIHFEMVESATDPFGADELARIRFFKDGSASPSTIVISGEKKNLMTIEISGASGAIQAYEGAPREPELPDESSVEDVPA
ncbi:prepilin-type N-terminal cleavage/methylation domain-containing protein [bacterium]|nr:prepilin-type N-terminal cleavage/methylation domain-containing protein [bacterium]